MAAPQASELKVDLVGGRTCWHRCSVGGKAANGCRLLHARAVKDRAESHRPSGPAGRSKSQPARVPLALERCTAASLLFLLAPRRLPGPRGILNGIFLLGRLLTSHSGGPAAASPPAHPPSCTRLASSTARQYPNEVQGPVKSAVAVEKHLQATQSTHPRDLFGVDTNQF